MDLQHQYIAFGTIVRREITRFTRIWTQTIVPPAVTTTLYFLIFGKLIGPRIGVVHGVPYIQYIVPGLVMMSIITSSYANVVASFYGSKFQRNLDEMLVSPMPDYIIVLGYAAGGVARGLCVGTVVTLVALCFVHLPVAHWGVMVSVCLLTSMLFAFAGLVNAIFANSFDDINIIPTFVLTPLTYLGGIFYSIDMLPDFWRGVSFVNPILYMVNGFRYGILGLTDMSIGMAYTIIIGFTVVMFLLCLYLLKRGTGIRN
ncbi:MAG TPA: ABC transporter permease [Gammaproteobacteria bacterium]|nr:ABC transporter permease [Gammaproteobacteria bacterium]